MWTAAREESERKVTPRPLPSMVPRVVVELPTEDEAAYGRLCCVLKTRAGVLLPVKSAMAEPSRSHHGEGPSPTYQRFGSF